MPKFVGNTIEGSRHLAAAPKDATLVKLSYSQAVKLSATEIYYELDTSDRGSRGTLAKRWQRWYATVEAIESCAASTAKMRASARDERQRGILNLAHGLARAAQQFARDEADARKPYRLLGRNLHDAACVTHLARVGLLETALKVEGDYSKGTASYNDRLATHAVVGDAIEDAGGDRRVATMIGAVGRSVQIGADVQLVGWRA